MKIFLAGTESSLEHGAALVECRAPYVLTSFFHSSWGRSYKHIRPAVIAPLQTAEERLVDSGAFTLRTAVVATGRSHNAVGQDVDYDAYTHAYIKWLLHKRGLGLIDWWVEMDIARLTSQKWVEATRDKFVRSGLGRGLLTVWHSDTDWSYWLHLLKEAKRPGRSGYVAIEGHQGHRPDLDYNRFLHEAYKRGVKVHGFKMTTAGDLRTWPFYSVDSTSWLTTVYAMAPVRVRLGGLIQRRPGTKNKSGTRLLWRGPIPRVQKRKWRRDILTLSCKEWVRNSKTMTDYWLARGIDWERAIANPEIAA